MAIPAVPNEFLNCCAPAAAVRPQPMRCALSLPATAALLIASEEITSSLFGYGSFDETSVRNSSLALFYFALGLPAFSLIKVFSSFLFARHNTKIPFYFSIISVLINVVISLYYFKNIGFIIIPIATSISSWLNGFLLMVFVLNKNYFNFSDSFFIQLFKIFIVNLICLGLFKILINYFSNYFIFSNSYKFLAIILLVLLTFAFYLLISILIKAFKISDIKLNY